MSNLSQTHYCIDSITGVPMLGCSHDWDVTEAFTAGGKSLVIRFCNDCSRFEKWLQLSRSRSALKF
jgi:hypothetical protein